MIHQRYDPATSAAAGLAAALFCTVAWIGGGLMALALNGGAV